SIFRSLGKLANLAGRIVRPHWNSVAHGKPPQFAILNHAAIDSEIPKESAAQRFGISQRYLRVLRPRGRLQAARRGDGRLRQENRASQLSENLDPSGPQL